MEPGNVPPRTLIVGYGSTLRGDDGLGPRVAELLDADPRLAGATIMQRHQLTPELAADIAEAALVVLIDASEDGEPGEIAVRRLVGGAAAAGATSDDGSGETFGGTWTHHVDADSLLALARELWGAVPEAYVVGVGVESMELGEGLSPVVERALPEIVETVARLVTQHRAD
jgi:hydrogenase maturation protease